MTVVDTSVWVDHLRYGNKRLRELLEKDEVLVHPFVIGEIACGNLSNRQDVLDSLRSLPSADVITFSQTLTFIEKHKLFGKGVGYIDIHILASAVVAKRSLFS